MSENWLGIDVNFENVQDKTASTEFELLLTGYYRAEIKNVIKSVLGENDKPALTVNLYLEDIKTDFTHDIYLPQQGDEEDKIQFKKENLRNFFSRCAFNKLTRAEYNNLTEEEKQAGLKQVQNSPNGLNQFKGLKVLVCITQEPFISCDKVTKAINFTDIPTANLINSMPKKLLKLINDYEAKQIDMSKMPVILFSNKVSAHGFGFYNDFEPDKELKDSKSYIWVQENIKNNTAGMTNVEPAKITPKF